MRIPESVWPDTERSQVVSSWDQYLRNFTKNLLLKFIPTSGIIWRFETWNYCHTFVSFNWYFLQYLSRQFLGVSPCIQRVSEYVDNLLETYRRCQNNTTSLLSKLSYSPSPPNKDTSTQRTSLKIDLPWLLMQLVGFSDF